MGTVAFLLFLAVAGAATGQPYWAVFDAFFAGFGLALHLRSE